MSENRNETVTPERVTRTYDVDFDLFKWIEAQAAKEKRPVIRQVEHILEQARRADDLKNDRAHQHRLEAGKPREAQA